MPHGRCLSIGSIACGWGQTLASTSLGALPLLRCRFRRQKNMTLAGDRGSVWTGNRSLSLTRVAADGSMTSFPETGGIICIRRDRNGTIWSAGGGSSKLWRNSGAGFTPLPYPEEKVGPVISLAFDRNNDLWITTGIGGAYHFSHDEWSRQNEALGKKPGIIGAMAGDDAGNVWFGFSNHLVRWDGRDYRFCQGYRAAAVVWVCPEKYCSRLPMTSLKPLRTLRFRAATTAGTFFPSTGSSCE
jgi:hypothetical protein